MNVSSHTTCSRDIWTSCFDWVQPDPEAACMHACMQQASVLFASAGLNLKGGDTCFSIHDQHQFMCIFLGRGSGGWEKSVKWDIIELFASFVSMKMKENSTCDRGCLVFSASCIHLMHLAELLCGREACLPLCDSQAVQQGERVASLDEGRIPCLMAFFQVICSPWSSSPGHRGMFSTRMGWERVTGTFPLCLSSAHCFDLASFLLKRKHSHPTDLNWCYIKCPLIF